MARERDDGGPRFDEERGPLPFPLDADEIARRVAGGEGIQLEFKTGLPRAEKVARVLASFANTRGGLLLIGVGDRGEILGSPHPDATLADVIAIARDDVVPPLAPIAGIVTVGDERIVACWIARSDRRHAAILEDGTREFTRRTGSRTRSAEAHDLARIDALDPLAAAVLAACRDAGAGGVSATEVAAKLGIGRRRALGTLGGLERAGRLLGNGAPERRFLLA